MENELRVGLVGVGNNSSALVQGVAFYGTPTGRQAAAEGHDGILFGTLCGYSICNISFCCAFDVDSRKVGRDLHEALFAEPNCYPSCVQFPKPAGIKVQPAPVLDGIPGFLAEHVTVGHESSHGDEERLFKRCVETTVDARTDVLVNFLPSGAVEATRFFARVAATARAAYVNATPAPAVHDSMIVAAFEKAGVPLLGDDLESQFGSSLIHRTILTALVLRGLPIRHSYQVNLGGNMDFKNLTSRSSAKHASKHKAISPAGNSAIEVLPSGGFLRGLGDNKVGYITVEGSGWLGMPVTLDIKLKVQDSSNAAGVVVDVIRIAKAAKEHGLGGYLPLSYYFKNPFGAKLETEEALDQIRGYDRKWTPSGILSAARANAI